MILALVDDLIVGVRIEEGAKAVGNAAEIVASVDEARLKLKTGAVQGLVVDLATPTFNINELAAEARGADTWLIAFYPHVNIELRRRAEAAGVEAVYPRSRFLRDLPKLLLERLESKG